MRALLNYLDDDTPPRAASADPAPVGSFSPSVLTTPGSEDDIISATSSSQDSLATLPADNTSDVSPSDNREDSSGTSDASPTTSVFSSSQAKEVVDACWVEFGARRLLGKHLGPK